MSSARTTSPNPKSSCALAHNSYRLYREVVREKCDRKEYFSVIVDAFTKYVLLEHTSFLDAFMRTLKSLLTIVENDPRKTWRDELGNIQLALNSTKSTVTKYTPSELMFGIRSQTLGLSKMNVETTEKQNRLDLNCVRKNASTNIKKAADRDVKRFNRGRAVIKEFSKGDFVFIKNNERNQTKLDKKIKRPFVITNVLDNDPMNLKV